MKRADATGNHFLAGAVAVLLVMLAGGCTEEESADRGGGKARQSAEAGRQSASGSGAGSGGGDTATRDAGRQSDEANRTGVSAARLLARLKVSGEVRDGYDRDLFDHWAYDGTCDVRDRVLARQDRRDGTCGSQSGVWLSAYDGARTTDPGDFDVDHMVPLAEAWDSGARRWSDSRREQFANDLWRYSLIAVSASSNRSKSDQDPAEWLPENPGFRCPYVARWIAVKFRWRLSVDPRERSFLEEALAACRPAAIRLEAPVVRAG